MMVYWRKEVTARMLYEGFWPGSEQFLQETHASVPAMMVPIFCNSNQILAFGQSP